MNNSLGRTKKYNKHIRNYLSSIPSLSTTITKVLAVCNSPNTSANDLNKVISLDPVLTGNVLKLINSAYYSAMVDQVKSLTQAIIILGLNTIKNLALSTAVLGSIPGKSSAGARLMDNLWTHCISSGVMAKVLAVETGVLKSECEEYFVSGLLHDIGKIPMIQCFPKDYSQVIQYSQEKKTPAHLIEKKIFGIDHLETGRLIADKWKLKGPVFQCICSHHHPDQSEADLKDVVQKVSLSNIYMNKIHGNTSSGHSAKEDKLLLNLMEKQGFDSQSLKSYEEVIFDEIETAKTFMQMTKG